MRQVAIIVVVLAVAASAAAQEHSWACSYSDQGVQTEFDKKGNPSISHVKAGMDPFVLVLDLDAGEARLRANTAVEVIPVPVGGTLSFIEKTPTGLNVITLFVSSPLDKGGRVPFAQARHMDLAGPFPQQYFGTCTPIGG